MDRMISALTVSIIALVLSNHAFAATYALPSPSESLIGDMKYGYVHHGDDAASIGEKYNIGYNAIKNANPQLDIENTIPDGTGLQIPTQHLLPEETRNGIVINLPEMRMYYYPKGSHEVLSYPVGIGKIGRTIPIKRASVTYKKKNPSWIPPKDIREFNLRQGVVLPRIMPPGPDNPLGNYAIYMSIPTFLMHSTIYPESIGRRASFGCIRMYESDIEGFFPIVTAGTPILIINQPVKMGWQDNALYLEAHHPLEEHGQEDATLTSMIHEITKMTKNQTTLVDWQAVAYQAKVRDGIPHDIGIKI